MRVWIALMGVCVLELACGRADGTVNSIGEREEVERRDRAFRSADFTSFISRADDSGPSGSIDPVQLDQARNTQIGDGVIVAGDDNSWLLFNDTAISCNSGYMSVSIGKDQLIGKYGTVNGEQFSFRDTDDPSCRTSPRASNRTHFVLATLNSHCATSVSTHKAQDGSTVQLIQNQVIFHPSNNSVSQKMTVNISCSIRHTNSGGGTGDRGISHANLPKIQPIVTLNAATDRSIEDYSTSNHSFRLILSDKQWTGPEAETAWVKHPFEVTIGSRLYAQIQIVQATDDDLKAYAKECFYSKNSDPVSEPKFKIITSGCKAVNSVITHHSKVPPRSRYTRFSFLLERIYFDSNYMYFQCKVVACSLRGGRESEGYETCPNSSFCTDRTIDSRYVPMESPYSYVSSGLMRPIMKSDSDEGKAVTCPPCPPLETVPTAPEQQQASNVVIVNGVSVSTVVCIGVGSFFVGIFLMGGLWCVRDHTDPKRYLKRRYSDRDSSSFLPVPPAPDTFATATRNGLKDEVVPIRTQTA